MLVLVQRRGAAAALLYSRALLPWAQNEKKCCISWRRRSAVYAAPSGQTCVRRTRGSILEFHSASAIFASEEAVAGLIRWVLEQIGGKFCFPAVAQRRAPWIPPPPVLMDAGKASVLPIIRLAPESRLRRGDEVLAAARTPDLSSHNPLPKPSRLSRERRCRPRCVGYRTTRADSDRAGCRR